MEQNQRNKLTIIIITMAFLSPLVLSWWYLNYTNIVSEGKKSNHGDLISPPHTIDNLQLHDPVADKDYQLYGKWNLVYIARSCDGKCVDNLYRMRQLHIAMDKYSLRVQRVLLLTDSVEQDLKTLFTEYAGQRIVSVDDINVENLVNQFQLNKTDDPLSANRLYIIDPLGNLMMSYSPDVNPRGIMDDLKKLLKASRIG